MRYTTSILLSLMLPLFVAGQTNQKITAEGFVTDRVTGAPLTQTKVTVYDDKLISPLAVVETDEEGWFSVQVPKVERYKIQDRKSVV